MSDSVAPVLTLNYSLPWCMFKLLISVSVEIMEITCHEHATCSGHSQCSEPCARRLFILESEIKLSGRLVRHWARIIQTVLARKWSHFEADHVSMSCFLWPQRLIREQKDGHISIYSSAAAFPHDHSCFWEKKQRVQIYRLQVLRHPSVSTFTSWHEYWPPLITSTPLLFLDKWSLLAKHEVSYSS